MRKIKESNFYTPEVVIATAIQNLEWLKIIYICNI